jgi:DNA-binding SARP family transcriptional activator
MPALAKLTRPKTHKAMRRERLFAELDEARQCPLIWITSPPGAGKTTLVSNYLENRRVRSLWCQLDAGDSDIATFFHYLARAAPARKPDEQLPQFLPGHRGDLSGFCRLFFRALYSRASAPVLLAFDNYHELGETSALHGLLQHIVAEVPQDHSIVSPVEWWPWPIRVYTLGRFEVQRQGQPLEFSRKAPKKTLALLKVIIANGGVGVREQRLLDALWSDEEGDVAARSLTAALHRLRGLLGDSDAIFQQGGTLSLNQSRVWVDAQALEDLFSQTVPIDVNALLALYRGNFLAEDETEPWSVMTRERLRSRFIHALGIATAALEQQGEYQLAIECYLRGIDCDPVIEAFYQGLMRCYASTGRRAEAVAAYRRLKHILSVALSLKPSAATERLHQSLRLD